jgi:hypothetical protein
MLVKFVTVETYATEITPEALQEAIDSGDVIGYFDHIFSDLNGPGEDRIEDEDGNVLWQQKAY